MEEKQMLIDPQEPQELLLKSEEGAADLALSESMKPYRTLLIAMQKKRDSQTAGFADARAALKKIAALPLEERYVWRVVSALKWAFADFDDALVKIDKATLCAADLARLQEDEFLKFRSLQFCLFLKTLFGKEKMARMMVSAIFQANK